MSFENFRLLEMFPLLVLRDPTVDGRNPFRTTQDTMGNHCWLLFTGDHIILWFLNGGAKWISSIHSIFPCWFKGILSLEACSPLTLDCYWVGSLDFKFWEIKVVFSTKSPRCSNQVNTHGSEAHDDMLSLRSQVPCASQNSLLPPLDRTATRRNSKRCPEKTRREAPLK